MQVTNAFETSDNLQQHNPHYQAIDLLTNQGQAACELEDDVRGAVVGGGFFPADTVEDEAF